MSIEESAKGGNTFREKLETFDGHAEFLEGLWYHMGWHGYEKKPDEVLKNYKKAAELTKIPSIQYIVGTFYEIGTGTDISPVDAEKWYLLAAENGCVDAQYALWELYYEEYRRFYFCSRIAEGLKWLEKAAESGLPKAEHDFGRNYLEGEIVDKDEKKGFAWVLKAAEKGHLNAQYITSANYMFGIGVEKDEKKGFEWLAIAASHDYPPAIYGVGRCYELGLGVAQDFEKAYTWFAKAAHLYDLDAISSLMEDEEEEEDNEEV